nr:acetylcholine receptor subunit alpha-L1-like [Lytechinus pictus]
MAYLGSFDAKTTMICLLLAASCLLHFAAGNTVRSRLYTKMLMDYQALMSPNQDTVAVTINVALSIHQIGQVNEADGTVKVCFGLYQSWMDPTLSWDMEEYNITSIYIPRHAVWEPDTTLHMGVATKETSSKNVLVFASGKVADVSIMEASLPCVKGKPSDESSNGLDDEMNGKTRRRCTLKMGCAIQSHAAILYHATPPDVTALEDIKDEWWLDGVIIKQEVQSRPSPHGPISLATFNFNMIRNTETSNTPIQLVAPSIMTSLAALGVFFLPPMAGERILMVGMAFLGQLILAGFSVLVQIQSHEQTDLYNFMLFSTVYIFLIIAAVLLLFFVLPLLKRFKTKEGNTEEDGEQLLTIAEKKLVSTIPDAVMFIIFISLYIVGLATLFS